MKLKFKRLVSDMEILLYLKLKKFNLQMIFLILDLNLLKAFKIKLVSINLEKFHIEVCR